MCDIATDGKIPLGLCKQAVMKLDSALVDINEIREDPDLTPDQKATFETLSDIICRVQANIVNIVAEECGEEEFLSEIVDMDEIDPYPGSVDATDILDTPIA